MINYCFAGVISCSEDEMMKNPGMSEPDLPADLGQVVFVKSDMQIFAVSTLSGLRVVDKRG